MPLYYPWTHVSKDLALTASHQLIKTRKPTSGGLSFISHDHNPFSVYFLLFNNKFHLSVAHSLRSGERCNRSHYHNYPCRAAVITQTKL